MLIFFTLLIFLAFLCFLNQKNLDRLKSRFESHNSLLWLPVFPVFFYLLVATSLGKLNLDVLRMVALYFAFPTLFLYFVDREKKSMQIWDGLAILALWLPYDLRWMNKSWQLGGSFGFPMNTACSFIFALVAFGAWRNVEIGLKWKMSRSDLKNILGNFFVLALILALIGLAIGFIKFGITDSSILVWPFIFLGIFLSVALPEELLFRGLMQNMLKTRFGLIPAVLIASIVFGIAHINNHGFPNYKYVFLATIAGIAYGLAYNRKNSIIASALVHTLVDFTWVTMFRG